MALIRSMTTGSSELSKGKYVELYAGGGTYEGSCATYTSGTAISKSAAAIAFLIKPNGNNTKIDFSAGANANVIIAAIKNDDIYDVYNTHGVNNGTKTYAEAVDYVMVLANASSAANLSVKVTDL